LLIATTAGLLKKARLLVPTTARLLSRVAHSCNNRVAQKRQRVIDQGTGFSVQGLGSKGQLLTGTSWWQISGTTWRRVICSQRTSGREHHSENATQRTSRRERHAENSLRERHAENVTQRTPHRELTQRTHSEDATQRTPRRELTQRTPRREVTQRTQRTHSENSLREHTQRTSRRERHAGISNEGSGGKHSHGKRRVICCQWHHTMTHAERYKW